MAEFPPLAPVAFTVEPEIAVGRRAFAMAQDLFFGAARGPETPRQVGWYDTSIHPEVGSFACIATGGGLDDLIGEIVRVRYNNRTVFAYVLQDVSLPEGVELGLTRRTFAALARLQLDVITASVVVALQ